MRISFWIVQLRIQSLPSGTAPQPSLRRRKVVSLSKAALASGRMASRALCGSPSYIPGEHGPLVDAGGVAERIWTADSIRRCTLLVTWPGVGAIPFLVASAAVLLRRRSYVLPARPARPASPVTVRPAATVYDAFLSYRHLEPDRAIALDLVETLERRGLRVAIDGRDFSPNEHFLSEMERCIKQSRFVLCVITSSYAQSDHTSEEAIISKTMDLAERRRRLVPLIFERVELPVWLHGLVGIDFTPAASVDPRERLDQLLDGRDA